ncbi:MAG: methyltransferase domain-containing protein [Dokdonella sp.]
MRLNATEAGVRCVRCAASAVHLQLSWAIRETLPDLSTRDVCELSARGPLVDYLQRNARTLTVSEYFEDVSPGALRGGVRCEDVQRLTYADSSFDMVSHTEVLEHVPDDALALGELLRVLRPGGVMLFTVPLHSGECTLERARLVDGGIEHLREPVYHNDPQRRESGILAFRDYGRDILDRLGSAGFVDAKMLPSRPDLPWLEPREIVHARKPFNA